MILAAPVDRELLVHGLIFEYQQRGERRHHVHGLAERDDVVLVLLCTGCHQSVDFTSSPDTRQVARVLRNAVDVQRLLEFLTVDHAANRDRLRQLSGHRNTRDRSDFLAVSDGLCKGQPPRVLPFGLRTDFQQTRRVQCRKQFECAPGDLFVRIDLREVSAGLPGCRLHKRLRPTLADADADILCPLRQSLQQIPLVPFANGRSRRPDVDQP